MDKKIINDFWNEIDKHFKAPELSYTEVVIRLIKEYLKKQPDFKVGKISWDLNKEGSYLSSKKKLDIEFRDSEYTITITKNNEK